MEITPEILGPLIPERYHDVAGALMRLVMEGSGNWSKNAEDTTREQLDRLGASVARINERFSKGEIDEVKYALLIQAATLGFENNFIALDVLDEQAERRIVRATKEVVSAVVKLLGVNLDSFLLSQDG